MIIGSVGYIQNYVYSARTPFYFLLYLIQDVLLRIYRFAQFTKRRVALLLLDNILQTGIIVRIEKSCIANGAIVY